MYFRVMPGKKIDDRSELSKKFGAKLAVLREKKGYTSEELGLKVGMHKQAISRLENGWASPSLDTVNKLCEALGIKLARFFKDFK